MREAILHLGDDQLANIGLEDVVTAAREAGLRTLSELVCTGAGGVILFEVAEPMSEGDLDDFESVVWWERLPTAASGVTYLCKIEAPALPEDFAPDDLGITHDIADVREDGVDLSVIGSQRRISEGITAASDAGMDLMLRRLSEYEGRSSTLDALTDRQREVIEAAYAAGYYDVPRAATTEAVAAEVGVDSSTVAEHLQRAERNLLARIIGDRS